VRLDSEYDRDDLFTIRLARGCLGNCSYCAIKFAAGTLESKPIGEILLEFKKGLSQGHRLFTLIAGDTGCYGIDIGTSAVELLSEIFKVDGAYKLIIKEFNAQWLIKYQSELETLLTTNFDKIDYIIVPVQSASDKILRLMQRPYNIENVKNCLRSLKSNIPQLNITTHIMAGFPEETEEDFQKSVDFIREKAMPVQIPRTATAPKDIPAPLLSLSLERRRHENSSSNWHEMKLINVILKSLIALLIRSTLRQRMYSLIRFRCETWRVIRDHSALFA
jgi:threonylcarbamoyladenosine tRNA methylthiotransferase CDKAL1